MFALRMLADFDPVVYPHYAKNWRGVVIYSQYVNTREQAENFARHWQDRTTKPDADEVCCPPNYDNVPEQLSNVRVEIVDSDKEEVPYNGDQYPEEYQQCAAAVVAKLGL